MAVHDGFDPFVTSMQHFVFDFLSSSGVISVFMLNSNVNLGFDLFLKTSVTVCHACLLWEWVSEVRGQRSTTAASVCFLGQRN